VGRRLAASYRWVLAARSAILCRGAESAPGNTHGERQPHPAQAARTRFRSSVIRSTECMTSHSFARGSPGFGPPEPGSPAATPPRGEGWYRCRAPATGRAHARRSRQASPVVTTPIGHPTVRDGRIPVVLSRPDRDRVPALPNCFYRREYQHHNASHAPDAQHAAAPAVGCGGLRSPHHEDQATAG